MPMPMGLCPRCFTRASAVPRGADRAVAAGTGYRPSPRGAFILARGHGLGRHRDADEHAIDPGTIPVPGSRSGAWAAPPGEGVARAEDDAKLPPAPALGWDRDGLEDDYHSIGSPSEEVREPMYIVAASAEGEAELAGLVRAAGQKVVGAARQKLDPPKVATLIGKGKVWAIRRDARHLGATTIVFDCELSPAQAKNLERMVNAKPHAEAEADDPFDAPDDEVDVDLPVSVTDRTALILDIFSQRAATREGKLQVAMAQAQYQLPRLARLWTHLERQSMGGGTGAGNRGMGETQKEVDKRILRKRIASIKRELEQVRAQRGQFRRRRARAHVPVVALVGYTNAGKSSLLNRLASANANASGNGIANSSGNGNGGGGIGKKHVAQRDQLFATLDPTTRKVRLPSGKRVLVTDTVGFVRHLPATLVTAFRATLEEIGAADVLIHVVDVSSPSAHAQVAAVEQTLAAMDEDEDMAVRQLPVIHAWNKMDAAADPEMVRRAAEDRWPATVCVSARGGEGIPALLRAVEEVVAAATAMAPVDVTLPYHMGSLLDLVHSQGILQGDVEYLEHGVRIRANIPSVHLDKFRPFANQKEDERNFPP